jgi:murein L,D-transpeptidase YcbB/YkuD
MRSIVFTLLEYPKSILDKEILPGKKNANYLEEHDMEWHGDYVRQKPGPKNSLGLIKFLFPNSNAIYLRHLQRVYSIEKIEPSVTVY